MSIELKIKTKHLSEEAKIIRFEERKQLLQSRWYINNQKEAGNNSSSQEIATKQQILYRSINQHRRWDVRNENRATFLARAYIAGKAYNEVEQRRKPENEYKFTAKIIPRVVAMVEKYGAQRAPQVRMERKDAPGRSYFDNDPAFMVKLKDSIIEWSTL
mgnify:CR=1 FL=1